MSVEDPIGAEAEVTVWAADLGLSAPPIPLEFRDALRGIGDHIWSTRSTGPSPYSVRQLADELDEGDVADYLLLGADGHGMNSFALHWHCVQGSVAILTQVRWGGVETQSPVHAARADAVLRSAEDVRRRVVEADRPGFGIRIVASDFSPCSFQVIGADGVAGAGRDAEGTVREAVEALDALGLA